MVRFLLVSLTGWAAVFGIAVEAALPYLLRNASRDWVARTRSSASPQPAPSLLQRMWPHYWLGYALLVLIMAHASWVMGPVMGRTDALGIWAATLALCLVILQIGLGLILKGGTADRRRIRRWHFGIMLATVVLVLTHLLRNA